MKESNGTGSTPTTPSQARPATRFVADLPDLITEEDYLDPPGRQKIRLRISITDTGVDVLGDSMFASRLEDLFAALGAEEIERMLCG